ncbi:hypothetical protein GGS20DRAFT_561185 [Poronia punctata]|nr:hypothetical protein GGS20DRAFT_561185 [Poronia punctata]
MAMNENIPPAPVYLIPWDPDSEEHVERMKVQRIACGWKVELVESWRESQRKGDMGMHWVVLHPSHPSTTERLSKHTTAFPDEASALRDTCKFVLHRAYRPSESLFHPIGHIALDAVTGDSGLLTSLSEGILSLSKFYISTALQNAGLGGAAMNALEKMAKEEFNAKAITLDTIAREECRVDSPRRIAMKRPVPSITNQDWYERRGYKVYGGSEWVDVDDTGKEWPVKGIYLRKELV